MCVGVFTTVYWSFWITVTHTLMTAAGGSQPQLKSEIKGVSALPNGTPSNSPLQFPSSHFRLVFQGRCWMCVAADSHKHPRSPLNHWWILIKHACVFHLHFAGAFTQSVSVSQTHDVRYECRFPHCKNKYIIFKSYIPEWMQSYYTVKKWFSKLHWSMFYKKILSFYFKMQHFI